MKLLRNLSALLVMSSPLLWAQPSLEDLHSSWDRQIKKIEVASLFAIEKIKPAYERALQAEQAKAQNRGELELLLELKDELNRVKANLVEADPPSDTPTVQRLQQSLAEQIGRVEETRRTGILQVSKGYRRQLWSLQTALTRQGDIEGALSAKAALETLHLRPEFRYRSRLAVKGGQPQDWEVVFRGNNPFKFGQDIDSESTYSIPLDQVPEDTKYMRLANLSDPDFVVLEISAAELAAGMAEGTYRWRHRTNETHAVLGIVDFSERHEEANQAYFSTRDGVGYSGWGYAPITMAPDEDDENVDPIIQQGLCWNGTDLRKPILLEVSVSSTPLSETHLAKRLSNPIRVPKPAPGAGGAAGAGAMGNLPPRIARSMLLDPTLAATLGAVKKTGQGAVLGSGVTQGRLMWGLSKIRSGIYDVHITYSSSGGGMLSFQGSRPTSATRSKITLQRTNVISRKTRVAKIRQDVFKRLQLGGFLNLELIFTPRTGYEDTVTIHRVELTASAR